MYPPVNALIIAPDGKVIVSAHAEQPLPTLHLLWSEQIGARLDTRWDKAEQLDVKVSIIFNLFIRDLSFGEAAR